MERNKKRLLIIVIISFIIAVVSFIFAGIISAHLLPYQDATPELLEKYDNYVKTYTPVWYFLVVTFFISFVAFFINGIRLIIGTIKDRKNISNIR